jgi:hypothetical protein
MASMQKNKDVSPEIKSIVTEATFWATLDYLSVLIRGISHPQGEDLGKLHKESSRNAPDHDDHF